MDKTTSVSFIYLCAVVVMASTISMMRCRAESVPMVMSVPQKSLSMEPTMPTMLRRQEALASLDVIFPEHRLKHCIFFLFFFWKCCFCASYWFLQFQFFFIQEILLLFLFVTLAGWFFVCYCCVKKLNKMLQKTTIMTCNWTLREIYNVFFSEMCNKLLFFYWLGTHGVAFRFQ